MTTDAEAIACTCAHLADERKAEQIVVLEVGQLAFFTDYFVIATGRNERQIQAIAQEIESRMKSLGWEVIGVEGEAASGWVLVDLGDAVVHLFDPEARGIYDLELLWGAAPRTDWEKISPQSLPAPGRGSRREPAGPPAP
ncbi:MAG: ribosome silencing factor [Planctomycetota bacterium]